MKYVVAAIRRQAAPADDARTQSPVADLPDVVEAAGPSEPAQRTTTTWVPTWAKRHSARASGGAWRMHPAERR